MSSTYMPSMIRPLDLEALRQQYRDASPYPHFKIDNFLDDRFALEVANAYPSYQTALAMGKEYNALNERLKVQVTDRTRFPNPVGRLCDELNSHEFLSALEYITGIPNLKSDEQLAGGGMHVTGSGGLLDVHVDFNYIADRKLHRRLNILVYLNENWDAQWGGNIELWDSDVRNCMQSFPPVLNRCLVFETSENSYHGVTPVACPKGVMRKSFAAYYYTTEPPAGWDGEEHSTVFRARPNEAMKGLVLMPTRRAWSVISNATARVKRAVKKSFFPEA